MARYTVKVAIEAPSDRVWSLLTEAADYADWNSSIARIEGYMTAGAIFKVWPASDGAKALKLKVAAYEPFHRMVWVGGLPLGLFNSRRTFLLTEDDAGTTHVEMTEVYSGILSGMMTQRMPDLQPDFDTFVASLKVAAESGP